MDFCFGGLSGSLAFRFSLHSFCRSRLCARCFYSASSSFGVRSLAFFLTVNSHFSALRFSYHTFASSFEPVSLPPVPPAGDVVPLSLPGDDMSGYFKSLNKVQIYVYPLATVLPSPSWTITFSINLLSMDVVSSEKSHVMPAFPVFGVPDTSSSPFSAHRQSAGKI